MAAAATTLPLRRRRPQRGVVGSYAPAVAGSHGDTTAHHRRMTTADGDGVLAVSLSLVGTWAFAVASLGLRCIGHVLYRSHESALFGCVGGAQWYMSADYTNILARAFLCALIHARETKDQHRISSLSALALTLPLSVCAARHLSNAERGTDQSATACCARFAQHASADPPPRYSLRDNPRAELPLRTCQASHAEPRCLSSSAPPCEE